MKTYLTTGAALLLTTTAVHAVGLDRSNQDITAIFESGNYVELSFGSIRPDVSGADLGTPTAYDGVAGDFVQTSASLTYQINDRVSAALIIDQPFGVDVAYAGSPATSALGGTSAELNSRAITALARYRINENFSVHGGLRTETLDGSITLSGAGFGPLSGYNVELASSSAVGYVAGVAYERPDIALRVALTYNSSMEHEFDTVEAIGPVVVNPGSVTTVETPEALNLDFQTGVAADTLVFGSIRYARYSDTLVSPAFYASQTGGGSLTDIDDGTAYTIGVGRRFSDAFSASVSYSWEAEGDSPLVSPLSPTNGSKAISIGGQYTMGDIVLSGGVRYTRVGDAMPETAVPVANFTDNDVVAIGMSIGYRF